MKLHLGCGCDHLKNFINVDCIKTIATDIVDDCVVLNTLVGKEDTFEEIYLNAVYEHLYKEQRVSALNRWCNLLKIDGLIKINSIPDMERMCKAYLSKEKVSCIMDFLILKICLDGFLAL